MNMLGADTKSFLILALLAGMAGCDIESYEEAASAFNENAPPPPPPSPDPPPPTSGGSFNPMFSEIQSNVFTPSCAVSGCHTGGAPSAGLNLDAGSSYAMLIDIASTQDSTIDRVEPGDPSNSYMIQKLEGTAATGGQMPPSVPMVQADIDVIRQWITDGAMDDTVVPPAAAVKVSSISPAPGATMTVPPNQIVAGFDRPLDRTTVNANTFVLTAAGGDNVFDGTETPIAAASISTPTSMSAVFDLGATSLTDDRYRIQLLGSSASLIMDADSNALDGEYLGLLPSGDGMAGGDFDVQFEVSTPVVSGPTLDEIQNAIFTPSCAAACHSGANPSAGLDLSDRATSYAQLVGVPSTQDNAILRVEAFNPDNSYLVQKMEGRAATGNVMPPSGMLGAALIADVRQWILDGAAP